MTYLANVEAGEESSLIAVLEPTLRLTNPDQESGIHADVYSKSIFANFVSAVSFNGTAFTEVFNLSDLDTPGADRYYFDVNAQKIYLDLTGRTPFDLNDIILIDYRIHYGSKEFVFFDDPENGASEPTNYLPYLQEALNIKRSVQQNIRGFMPAVSSNLTLLNTDYEAAQTLLNSTLSKKRCRVYAISGERVISNTFKFLDGQISSVSLNDNTIRLRIDDKLFDFNGRFQYKSGEERFTAALTSVTTVDPAYANRNIPEVWGVSGDVLGVYGNYVDEAATTSDNNRVVLCKHYAADLLGSRLAYTVQSSSGSVVTMDTVKGLNINDELVTGADVNVTFITGIDYDLNTVTFNSSLDVPANGTTVYRDRIGGVWALDTQTGALFARLSRNEGGSQDYSVNIDTSEDLIWLNVANNGGSIDVTGNRATHIKFIARVYGEDYPYQINGSDLYQSDRGYRSKAHQVIYDYINEKMPFSETDFDVASLEALEDLEETAFDVGIQLPVPTTRRVDLFPRHRETIADLLDSDFLSFFQTPDNRIKMTRTSRISATDRTITKDDLLSFSYNENYSDTVEISQVAYNITELQTIGGFESVGAADGSPVATFQDASISDQYNATKEETVETRLFSDSQATTKAQQNFYVEGFPFQTFTIRVPAFYLDVEISDVITVERPNVPGIGQSGTITGKVIETAFDGRTVTLKIWTQYGVQTNQGVW